MLPGEIFSLPITLTKDKLQEPLAAPQQPWGPPALGWSRYSAQYGGGMESNWVLVSTIKLLDQAFPEGLFKKREPINCLYDLRLFELRFLFLVTKVTRTDTAHASPHLVQLSLPFRGCGDIGSGHTSSMSAWTL